MGWRNPQPVEGHAMRETHISIPELGLVAGTRGALGAGIGLLLADRLSPEQRRAIGWALLAVGVLSTIPLAVDVFGRSQAIAPDGSAGQGIGPANSMTSGRRETAAATF